MAAQRDYTESEVVAAFRQAMAEHGLRTTDAIEPTNGAVARFHVDGDSKGTRNGWYVLFVDGGLPAGEFGSWKTGASVTWCAKEARSMTPAEQQAVQKRIEAARAKRDAEKRQREGEAARTANLLWNDAKPADDSHPYLRRKGVPSHNLRVTDWPVRNSAGEVFRHVKNTLLIPVMDARGRIISLQGIFPEKDAGFGRDKDFWKHGRKRGGYYMIGQPKAGGTIAVCEGYATGATIHAATGWCVLIAFDAGNLNAVAEDMREALPDYTFVICADNDAWTTEPVKNPGVTFAKQAAQGINARCLIPEFKNTDTKPTDWNDLCDLEGEEEVQRQLMAHTLPAPANDNDGGMRDEQRRAEQKAENERLQDVSFSILPPSMSVEDMLTDCVWIASGSQVGVISNPKTILNFGEFSDLTASSVSFETGDDGRRRRVLHAVKWKQHAERLTVYTRTFHAGAGAICTDPDGQPALNSWRPIERRAATCSADAFVEQVAYLFAETAEREAFLDWLAHIEQSPGVLPHYGWLHVAANTGTGRNWLASVLARLWRGYVAPNVDLPALLDSQFNGQLAGRVLAIVDEVQEAAGENPYRHTNKLKSLVNAEYRDLNPKFGRQYREHNACRWLVFSNHDNALPLNDTDRRWRVVRHDNAPRRPEDYAALYALLGDAEFINSVGVYLRNRDIAAFKPGERPPMSAAKLAGVEASKTLVQKYASQLVAYWPVDVATNADVAAVLSEGRDQSLTPAMRRAMEELGCVSLGRTLKVKGQVHRCWILRDRARWEGEAASALAAEVARARYDFTTQTALDVLGDAVAGGSSADEPPF